MFRKQKCAQREPHRNFFNLLPYHITFLNILWTSPTRSKTHEPWDSLRLFFGAQHMLAKGGQKHPNTTKFSTQWPPFWCFGQDIFFKKFRNGKDLLRKTVSFIFLQTNSASEIQTIIIQTNSSKTAVAWHTVRAVCHAKQPRCDASPKIFPVSKNTPGRYEGLTLIKIRSR